MKKVLLWLLSVVFIFAGLGMLGEGKFSGVFALFAGVAVCPLFWKFVERKRDIPIEKGYKIALFAILVILAYVNTVPTNPLTIPVAAPRAEKPTPTPTDPCWQYYGTDKAQFCIQTENAQREGQALDHPLKGTVTVDDGSIYITNNEDQEWAQCIATLDETDPSGDNFASGEFIVKPGQTERLGWGTFTNNEQQRFNYFQTKPSSISVDCTVGGTTDPKTGIYKGGQEHRSIFNL